MSPAAVETAKHQNTGSETDAVLLGFGRIKPQLTRDNTQPTGLRVPDTKPADGTARLSRAANVVRAWWSPTPVALLLEPPAPEFILLVCPF